MQGAEIVGRPVLTRFLQRDQTVPKLPFYNLTDAK
jgi:hypothetical protein